MTNFYCSNVGKRFRLIDSYPLTVNREEFIEKVKVCE